MAAETTEQWELCSDQVGAFVCVRGRNLSVRQTNEGGIKEKMSELPYLLRLLLLSAFAQYLMSA